MRSILQDRLFANGYHSPIRTESIKYIGSKLRILPYIRDITQKIGAKKVFDGFTGSTRVAQLFAQIGCDVVASDRSKWSEVLAKCYLRHHDDHKISILIDELNNLNPVDGWFTEHYGGDSQLSYSNQQKKPWQKHNTRKLDAIRDRISDMALEPEEEAVMLTSLMMALDRVDNTLGHFVSYLNGWSARSYQTLELKKPLYIQNSGQHTILRGDIFDIIEQLDEVDLAYLDPPYGSNNEKMPPSRVRYASYYHIWTTVCLNDKPKLFGKAMRRIDSRDSASGSIFEEFRRGESGQFLAVEAIENLIRSVPANYILLSYSSGGRATADELMEVLESAGRIQQVLELEYKRNVMASMKWTDEWIRPKQNRNIEYLFLLKK
ncbi:MAG: DNA adenine methylase [Pseudomonadota bacterium]